MIYSGCDLQIAVFLLLSLFWTKHDATTKTPPPKRLHYNNHPTTLPFSNNAQTTSPTRKHRLAIILLPLPASIASPLFFFLFLLGIAEDIGVWPPDWRGGGSFLVRYKAQSIRGTERLVSLS